MSVISLADHNKNRKTSVPSLATKASVLFVHKESSLIGKNQSFRQNIDECCTVIQHAMDQLGLEKNQRIEIMVIKGRIEIICGSKKMSALTKTLNDDTKVLSCLKRTKSTLAVRIFTLEAMHYASMAMRDRNQARVKFAHLNGDTNAIRVSLIYQDGNLTPRVTTPIKTYW